MNYRAEIDALPPEGFITFQSGLPGHFIVNPAPLQAKIDLLRRIHAEPHTGVCQRGMLYMDGNVPRAMNCTCGKDAALAEVLGQ